MQLSRLQTVSAAVSPDSMFCSNSERKDGALHRMDRLFACNSMFCSNSERKDGALHRIVPTNARLPSFDANSTLFGQTKSGDFRPRPKKPSQPELSKSQNANDEQYVQYAANYEYQRTDDVDTRSALFDILLRCTVFSFANRLSDPAERHVPNRTSSPSGVIRL